ncbi:hypothetical protein [Anaeromyxobacter oryzisoli]|uniref:hypothetical protein n=1 Tax=Anaeromyxobacter oryzisoli TaxID=2925408 RepID=UPI001F58BE9C|nr:hypothetical protein [Anaeromyxobacter sp. SG63]
MAKTVKIGWTHPETGEEFTVRCHVTPGVPEQRWGDGAHPAEAPEVEVLTVTEDRLGGVARPDLIEVVEADLRHIEERAIEAVRSAEDAAAEFRSEYARDERREARP